MPKGAAYSLPNSVAFVLRVGLGGAGDEAVDHARQTGARLALEILERQIALHFFRDRNSLFPNYGGGHRSHRCFVVALRSPATGATLDGQTLRWEV